tara:strand:+ start:6280 stop:7104 length:825 start_codon:yes stop_codon:yes gene_type:complete
MLTFNVARAVDRLPAGETIGAAPEKQKTKRFDITWPWEALPLALNWLLTGGTRDPQSDVAVFIRVTEKVTRCFFYTGAFILVSYMLAVGTFFQRFIHFGREPYALFTLVMWWLVMLLLLFVQLNGRLRALPATVSADEVLKQSQFHLPELFFNYQAFGFERRAGYVAAFIVLFVLVSTSAAWAVLLYETSSRLLVHDTYRAGFSMVWISYLVQHVYTACALSVSYGDFRAVTSKTDSPLTPLEDLRVWFANMYIFLVVAVLLPTAGTFVVYALS